MNDGDDAQSHQSRSKTRIQGIISKIIGLPAWDAGRTANLVWLQLGERHEVKSHFSNKVKIVGEWALHIQCAWRIMGSAGIEVASHDMYYPSSTLEGADPNDFDWDRQGNNRCDERLGHIFAHTSSKSLIVTKASGGIAGKLKVALGELYVLELFPNSSLPIEQWRLFQPYTDTPDIVFTGLGYQS